MGGHEGGEGEEGIYHPSRGSYEGNEGHEGGKGEEVIHHRSRRSYEGNEGHEGCQGEKGIGDRNRSGYEGNEGHESGEGVAFSYMYMLADGLSQAATVSLGAVQFSPWSAVRLQRGLV